MLRAFWFFMELRAASWPVSWVRVEPAAIFTSVIVVTAP